MNYHYLNKILIILFIVLPINIFSHGFGASTLISQSASTKEFRTIQLLSEDIFDETVRISSFDFHKNKCIKHRIKSAATAQTNCYYGIRFNREAWDDISCTPDQEFYTATRQWIPTHQLKIGDILFTQDKSLAQISDIQFCQQNLTVYSIRVKRTHNFFVGHHRVLTHNFLLPALTVGIGTSFGTGAATGGTVGAYFGPAAFGAGIVLGGCAGMIIKAFFGDNRLPHYEISYDVNNFKLAENPEQNKEQKNDSRNLFPSGVCGGSPNPEDPNNPRDWKRNWNKNSDFKTFPYGKYEDAPYHSAIGNSRKSSRPLDGQKALNNSLEVNAVSGRRVGISMGQFVILSRTSADLYHGHVRTWDELEPQMQNILKKAGWVRSNGKIII